ncbi:uncharacterized protein LOC114516999 isoform X2 [Dendronephthya gigantea]|uniref:uncharacterized protein LOC114516999 isoform X2 n=1 Tax=Dendronephthya gigantea TaxID=151771 RepID=UPI001069CDB9|nr:uncharacterized protein LOC114516999 isoform X2 [Dendronephthya gigantea]
MKNFSESHIIFLLFICALANEVAECIPICSAGTYYTEDLSACVACPVHGKCDDQYYRAVNRCKKACEKKTTPPAAPTIKVQEPTSASHTTEKPAVKTETLLTPSEKAPESKKNGTFRGGRKVNVGFEEKPDPTENKSSSSNSQSAMVVTIAVLVTLLVCGVVYFAYRKVKKPASGEDRLQNERGEGEQVEMCSEASNSTRESSPFTIRRINERAGSVEGIELPVPEQGNRTCSETEKMLKSTLLLEENEN